MTDMRTNFPIPKNTWVKVLDGKTAATFYKDLSTPVYMSLIYNDAVSDPNTLFPLTATTNQTPPTSQLMFSDGIIDEHGDPIPTYFWIACKSGKKGSINVTPGP